MSQGEARALVATSCRILYNLGLSDYLGRCAELVVNPQLGAQLADALGKHRVCHLQGHGIVSVGATIQEATLGAIHLERLAEVNYRVALLGREPRVIPEVERAALRNQLAQPAGRWAYYAELAAR